VDEVNDAAINHEDKIERFEDSIFTNDYITGGIDENYLNMLAKLRSEKAKASRQANYEDGQIDDLQEIVDW